MDTRYILPLEDVSMADLPRVGGKTASLGEMTRTLAGLGVRVPPGFAVTAQAWTDMLDAAGCWPRLHELLDGLDLSDLGALAQAGATARQLVLDAPMPAAVESALRAAWRELCAREGADLAVAVRSSATAEDLPTASFAGQHDTWLNVRGEEALVHAVKACQASLFTDRAIVYRAERGFDAFRVRISVAVQKMVRSDLAASGVVFTLDTESGHPGFVFVTGTWGLGESLVQGRADPDEFHVHKASLLAGHAHVLRRRIGRKQVRLVLGPAGGVHPVLEEPTPEPRQRQPCLGDEAVLELARAALRIEDHYSERAGHWQPMDIEWAQDGPGGALCIVQARPDTSQTARPDDALETYVLDGQAPLLASGRAVGDRIASGIVRRIATTAELGRLRPGEVLVAPATSPDWEPVMKTAAALVTESGGRTCHAAIVARELGIPAVVGVEHGCQALVEGQRVTVSCAQGDQGQVLAGLVPFHVERTPMSNLPRTRAQVMVNLGNPALAMRTARLPAAGVGLARLEFIISECIGVHPLAALQPGRIADPAVRAQVQSRWSREGWTDGQRFFTDRLAEGVATIAAAFHPRPVVVRLSDFKSNEYAALLGGADFEPREENPMLGWRGAARYLHPDWAGAFAMECEALARVRGPMGLDNVRLMVPFCRTVREARQVLALLAAHGLRRGEDGLQVLVMCEIPNNVVQVQAFCELFDGLSIGSNDLTQLTLGVDRDSARVAEAFDEEDPGVLELLRQAVQGARRCRRPIGICGQAPSDRPALVQRLVEWGIDSLSVTPDRLLATLATVARAEQALAPGPPIEV